MTKFRTYADDRYQELTVHDNGQVVLQVHLMNGQPTGEPSVIDHLSAATQDQAVANVEARPCYRRVGRRGE